MATPTTNGTDLRQAFTCAALATITSLGMFSVVANVMTPMLAGSALLTVRSPAQEMRASYRGDDGACVPTAHARDEPAFPRLTTI